MTTMRVCRWCRFRVPGTVMDLVRWGWWVRPWIDDYVCPSRKCRLFAVAENRRPDAPEGDGGGGARAHGSPSDAPS